MGAMHKDGVTWTHGGQCGRIKMFYEIHDGLFVHVAIYTCAGGVPTAFDERQSVDLLIEVREVIGACTWFYQCPSMINVAIPPIALLKI